MEEQEVPTEGLSEEIREHAEKAVAGKEKRLSMYIAVSTALMAVLAAISSLMAGHHSNEALIEQIKASDQWAFYQAKGIKGEIASLNGNNNFRDSLENKFKNEQLGIKKVAEEFQLASTVHLQKHILLARSVTFFQIAIAISAISILTKKTILWYASLMLAIVGIFYFVIGMG